MKFENTSQLAAVGVAVATLTIAGCGGGSSATSGSSATRPSLRQTTPATIIGKAKARTEEAAASASNFVEAVVSASITGLASAAAWLGEALRPPAAQASTGSVPGLAFAVPAHAATVSCQHSPYTLSLNTGRGFFPWVTRLAAVNVPRLTEGYAPRCLVAASVAGTVQQARGRAGSYSVYGARWSAGRWSVSFGLRQGADGPVADYTARHGHQLVTFRGTS